MNSTRVQPGSRRLDRFSCPGMFAWLLLVCFPSSAAEPEPPAKKLQSGHLTVGFAQQAFAGVNRTDAEAAFKAFSETVGRARGYDILTRSEAFETASGFEAAIRRSDVHVQIIPAWDYLKMDIREFSEPYFVAMDEGGLLEDYVLLTRRESGINTLANLRGQSVTFLESGNAYSSRPWIETVLLEHGLGRAEDFFGRFEVVSKPSLAVLPVFFGKRQACVVDRSGFQIMKELNPQIGERLRILTASEPLLGAVFCMQKTGWTSAKHRQDMIQGMADLHTEPAGQQILALFKVQRIVPFKAEYLESVKRLRAAHDRLSEAAKNGASTFARPSDERRNAP